MKITTLLENTACDPAYHAAHGLSLYLETPNHRILFDMGPDGGFAANAEALGVRLEDVDLAILSHGHYDHAGGLQTFLEKNGRAPVCIHRGAFGDYYAARPDGSMDYIGVDPALQKFRSRFAVTCGVVRVDDELTLFDQVDDAFGSMAASASLKEKTADGTYRPDAFDHEQNLLICAEGKTVLVAGCAHRGIVNIRDKAAALLGRQPDAVVAGFHLFQLEPDRPESENLNARIGETLLEGDTVYYTGHCTGDYAFEKLHAVMGDRLRRIRGGSTVEL